MTKLEIICERYPDVEFMVADGFDAAVIGVTTNNTKSELVLVYSRSLALMVLMTVQNMPYEDAIEYFDFNVEGAYMGDKTPIWVDDEMFTDMLNI